MSGDLGAEVVVRAARAALEKHPNLRLVLVGDGEELAGHITRIVGEEKRLTIRQSTEVVGMSESPADALRKKKDSSMRVAINMVKEGSAQACVSAGNTGALMATAKYVLKMLPGANTVGSPEQLFQFAVMGSIVTGDIRRIDRPRIALLNIGVEDTKGHDTVRDAAALLNESGLNYVEMRAA
jgi:glycerol-3-phosphate acyltransferase PlsX